MLYPIGINRFAAQRQRLNQRTAALQRKLSDVLVLEGTSVAGTESIYDLLSDKKELGQILENFKNPDGSLKHFEILLASQSVDGSAAKFHVVAFRAYS